MEKFFAKGGSGHSGTPGCTTSKPAKPSCSSGSQSLKTKVMPAKASGSSGSQKLHTTASPAPGSGNSGRQALKTHSSTRDGERGPGSAQGNFKTGIVANTARKFGSAGSQKLKNTASAAKSGVSA